MQPRDFITTARILASEDSQGKPRQTILKMAVSTTYYAMFNALCSNCADSLIGRTRKNRSQRGLATGLSNCRTWLCQETVFRNDIKCFPDDIQEFAKKFVDLQEIRHKADYDPHYSISRSTVLFAIDTAEIAIKQLESADRKDLKEFAVWTVMKKRAA